MSTTYSVGPASGTLRTSGIAAASVQNNKDYLGSAIANQTNLDAFADIELVWAFGVAPTANNLINVNLLWALDGTNYEEGAGDGTTVTAPLPGCMIGNVSPPADTSTHRKTFRNILIPPYPFKVLIENVATGQTATITVNVYTRKDQVVG